MARSSSPRCSSTGALHIGSRYTQPGKPNQNAFVERFVQSHVSTEVLDSYIFESLADVRWITEAWLEECNEERPHDATGRAPPSKYWRQIEAKVSTLDWST